MALAWEALPDPRTPTSLCSVAVKDTKTPIREPPLMLLLRCQGCPEHPPAEAPGQGSGSSIPTRDPPPCVGRGGPQRMSHVPQQHNPPVRGVTGARGFLPDPKSCWTSWEAAARLQLWVLSKSVNPCETSGSPGGWHWHSWQAPLLNPFPGHQHPQLPPSCPPSSTSPGCSVSPDVGSRASGSPRRVSHVGQSPSG